jgi:HTH-type transcriptional regulator, transcriptional repressor of NAD biosynthesis genes
MAIDGPARLGLIGGECTGKSTLAAALAGDLPACVVGETLREFVDREGRTPRQDEQRALMTEHQDREDAAAEACLVPTLVCDPASLMTAVYSVLYFDDGSLVAEAAQRAGQYGLLAWCDIDLPWQPDGVHRDGPTHRSRADDIIARIVRQELTPRGIAVVRASGSVHRRVAAVRRAWQLGGHLRPT